jgi:outer membrane murein-binding lipoprotein Lpp
MKTKYVKLTALAVSTLATTLLLAGCASTGYEKGNVTAANIQATSDRIAALPGQVDKTMASLNDLVNKPQADLRPQYQQFAANLAEMESSSKGVATDRRTMGEKAKEYLDAWDQEIGQIQNADIKARSQSRREAVNQQLVAIKKSYVESCTTFKPFLADLNDVQKYLSVDLTTGGITAIKEPVAKANRDAVPLKVSLTKLAGDFKAFATSMSSITPPPSTNNAATPQ